MKKVAIQGHQASFHHQAAQEFFGQDIEIVSGDTFKEVFEALKSGKAEVAVVAIENSLFGSINEVYDLLLSSKAQIVGEIYLRIEHNLIGLPNAKLTDINEVHSHPVALAQCEDYLDNKMPKVERFEHHDTAASVADVKKWADPTKAAIASASAAKLHGMKILAKNIETHHQNYTRFVVLKMGQQKVNSANKTSLVLKTADKPGALYHALGAFAENKINLTKLQSRPVIGQAWHYIFYVDVESGLEQAQLKEALSQLKKQGCETIVLGSYKAAKRQ